jgi:hypothetical protein
LKPARKAQTTALAAGALERLQHGVSFFLASIRIEDQDEVFQGRSHCIDPLDQARFARQNDNVAVRENVELVVGPISARAAVHHAAVHRHQHRLRCVPGNIEVEPCMGVLPVIDGHPDEARRRLGTTGIPQRFELSDLSLEGRLLCPLRSTKLAPSAVLLCGAQTQSAVQLRREAFLDDSSCGRPQPSRRSSHPRLPPSTEARNKTAILAMDTLEA